MTLKGSTAPRPNCDSAKHPKDTGPKMMRLYKRVNNKFIPVAWNCPGCMMVKIDWYYSVVPIATNLGTKSGIATFKHSRAWEICQQNANMRLALHDQYFKLSTPSFGCPLAGIPDEHPWFSWHLIISMSTENNTVSSGSSQPKNASLECIFANFTSFSPYC